MISIVVTSYSMDRFGDLVDLLDSVTTQSFREIEVVFVAERSAELLDAVARHAGRSGIPAVLLLNDGEPGISASRNLGVSKAKGDIIAFVDDDALLGEDWALETMRTFVDDAIIGVTGPALPLWANGTMPLLPQELYWLVSCTGWCDWKELTVVRNGWGHGMSFRGEAFSHCKFSDSFGRTPGAGKAGKLGPVGDDTEFCINVVRATGRKIVFNPKVVVHHKVHGYRLTPRFVRRQAYWQGYTKAMLKRIYGTDQRNLLDTEYALLKRIIMGLIPRDVRSLPTKPLWASKRLVLTLSVLVHLAIGYTSGFVPQLGAVTRRLYGEA